MSIDVIVNLKDQDEPARLSEEGLEYEDYDIDFDILALDMGDEPSPAYLNHKFAESEPLYYLINQCSWLGDECWGIILCDWAAEALSLSDADYHEKLFDDVGTIQGWWFKENDKSEAKKIYEKAIDRSVVCSSYNKTYDTWFNNTSQLGVLAIKYPFVTKKEKINYVNGALESLINTMGTKTFLDKLPPDKLWFGMHHKRSFVESVEAKKILNMRKEEAARLIELSTMRKIAELQDEGYANTEINCKCTKKDFIPGMDVENISKIV